MQNLEDVASTLQKTLTALRQQNGGGAQTSQSSSPAVAPAATSQNAPQSASQQSAPTNTQANTQQNANSGNTASAPNASQAKSTDNTASSASPTSGSDSSDATSGTDSTDASSSASASASSSDPAADNQTLAEIIAQIIALTHMVIKDLKQSQVASGASTGGESAVSATAPAAAASASAQNTDNLLASAPQPVGSGEASDAAASDDSDALPIDELSRLFADLQKLTQKFALDQTAAASASSSASSTQTTSAATPTAASIAAGMTAQLAQIDSKLKNLVKQLDQNTTDTIANAANSQDNSSTAAATVQTVNQSSPQDLSGTSWQSQMFAAQSGASSSSAATPTSSQVFAGSAAIVAAADNNSRNAGADSNADFSSQGRPAATPLAFTAEANTAGGTQATGTYSFASTLSALRASSGGTAGLPSVVDQVILQMNRSVKTGNDQMSLQLNPADLGKITVKLDFGTDGKVQGTVTADNPQTLGMLQKDSRSLERALQDAGLRADPGSLQFNLGSQGDNSGGNANQASQGNSGNADQSSGGDGTLSASDIATLSDSGVNAENYYITPGGVNIQV